MDKNNSTAIPIYEKRSTKLLPRMIFFDVHAFQKSELCFISKSRVKRFTVRNKFIINLKVIISSRIKHAFGIYSIAIVHRCFSCRSDICMLYISIK